MKMMEIRACGLEHMRCHKLGKVPGHSPQSRGGFGVRSSDETVLQTDGSGWRCPRGAEGW